MKIQKHIIAGIFVSFLAIFFIYVTSARPVTLIFPTKYLALFFEDDTTKKDPPPAQPSGSQGEIDLPYPFDDRQGDFINEETGSHPMYLNDPAIINREVDYDPSTGHYNVSERIGDDFYRNPTYLTFEEYLEQESQRQDRDYWKERAEALSLIERKGVLPKIEVDNNLFDKIFGGTAVDIRPSGNIDLTFGGNYQKIDNPTLTEQQRRQGGFDFDMNINLSVIGKIGDKLKLTTNYNTQATFDFENQIKLQYEGEEDDIIKSIEAGNVTLPLKSSLIQGSQSLFGVKTALQFGRLTVTSVVSQQRSQTQSMTVQGGAQLQEFQITTDLYDVNRHYFLAQFFYESYDNALRTAPIITSLANVTRLEVWVTNRTGATQNTRDVVGFMDLGEPRPYLDPNVTAPAITGSGPIFGRPNQNLPDNNANDLYSRIRNREDARPVGQVVATLKGPDFRFKQVQDFEKTFARQLMPSEYTLHPQLGYISINQQLNPDEVLAVAFEYTYNGVVYKVGEFAQDIPPDSTTASKVLFLKMLKSTSLRPKLPIWDLMMKNVYSIGAFQVNQQDFRLDVYFVDPGGGIKRYLPEGSLRGRPLIRVLGLDRMNNQGDPQPDGVFDFMPGLTINPQNGRIIFPVVKPFGDHLRRQFGENEAVLANKYVYDQLYDSTQIIAQMFPEYNRFLIKGTYKSNISSELSLGAFNVPPGSVRVTAGGQMLVEGQDYQVDYSLGRIKILNEGVMNSGVPINVSYENNALFGFQTKSMFGTRLDYWINDNFTLGGTILKLTERPFTQKVNFGDDPISNTVYGFDLNYSTESGFLTWLVDKLPFYETKEKSSITVSGEVARLQPGHSRAIGKGDEGTVYIDDFEGTRSAYDLRFPAVAWAMASTPVGARDKFGRVMFPEGDLINDLRYGYNRAKLAWYNIDPLFLRNNSATPSHISSDRDQQSNHYVREVQQREVFPNRDETQPGVATNILTFDLGYYPDERGPYNYEHKPDGEPGISAGVSADGKLKRPESRWGGIMRAIDNNDFEAANIEFIEFWVMDPFIYNSDFARGGEMYINLGNISEDILKDSEMFYENGLPRFEEDDNPTRLRETAWGKVPAVPPITNLFDANPQSRVLQDVGFDGLSDTEERIHFANVLDELRSVLNPDAFARMEADPSSDNFLYFRNSEYDQQQASILERYKKFNGPDGNSPVSDNNQFSASGTNMPDSEDLNRDNTINENEEYFQYRIELRPGMDVGDGYITDKLVTQPIPLPNGNRESITWYQFKIPINEYERRVGDIPDFKSIRFMRMYLTGFDEPVILRFARLELVRNQWRRFLGSLLEPGEYIPDDNTTSTFFNVSAVNIEENSEKQPVPYVVPPGIVRQQNVASNNYIAFMNEQSLAVQVCGLNDGDSRAVFKTLNMDLRQFDRLKMFTHAASVVGEQPLNDGDLKAFIRLGSDFKDNYYEYELPLKITPAGLSKNDVELIWPFENEFDILLDSLILVKQLRNQANASLISPYSIVNEKGNRISIVGNPDLGLVRTAMLGVRNPKATGETGDDGLPKCGEIWFNELRLTGLDERGGWAALGRVDMQLADLGNVTVSANMHTIGYGQLEQKVNQRFRDNFVQYDAATNLELGKFFPTKSGIRIPMYAGISQSFSTPEYDPYEFDVPLRDKLAFLTGEERRDYKRATQDLMTIKSLNFTNVRMVSTEKKKNFPWTRDNFNFTYAFTRTDRSTPIIEGDELTRHKGIFGYNYAPQTKYITPFGKVIKAKTPWVNLVKDINFNLIPSNLSFTNDMTRQFGETRLRPIGDEDFPIEPTYDKFFTWDRVYGFRYNPTKSINFDFNAVNNARVDEPFGRIDTQEKKDSLWSNLLAFGRTTSYSHSSNADYNLPISKIPLLDWVQIRTSYNSDYRWLAAPLFYDFDNERFIPNPLGNTISNSGNIRLNGEFNLKNLYNKWAVLKPYNQPTTRGATTPVKPGTKPPSAKEQRDKKIEKAQKDREKIDKDVEKLKNDLEKLKAEIQKLKDKLGDEKEDQEKLKQDLKKLKKDKKALKKRVRARKKDKQKVQQVARPAASAVVQPMLAFKRLSANYSINRNTLLPGYMPNTQLFGLDNTWEAPGWQFIFGYQPDRAWLDQAAANGWMTPDTNLNYQMMQSVSKNLNLKGVVEPWQDLRVDLTLTQTHTTNYTQYFKRQFSNGGWEHLNPIEQGSYTVSYISWKTLFEDTKERGISVLFKDFERNRAVISDRLSQLNPNSQGEFTYYTSDDSVKLTGFFDGYGPYSQEVMIPAFISAYTKKDPNTVNLNPFKTLPLPNWRLTYNGLSKFNFLKNIFTSFTLTHGYNSTFTVNSFISEIQYDPVLFEVPSIRDSLTGNFLPQYNIPSIVISEQLSPLIGVDMAFKNNVTAKFDFKKSRNLAMSFVDFRLNETKTTEFTIGAGYRIRGLGLPVKWKGKKVRLENDLNFKFDFSVRDNETVSYRLDQDLTEPTAGMKTIRISPSVDYVVSNRLNFRLFYDYNRTIPATSASYPITNTRAGITIRFSLTQ